MTARMEFRGGAEIAAKLKRMSRDIRTKELDNAGRAGSRVVRDEAKLRAPVRTGKLKDAIDFGKYRERSTGYSTAYRIGVRSKVWYFPLIEFGTGPHTIRRKRAKVLGRPAVTFLASGEQSAQVYGTQVEHPGTSAKGFFRAAWESSRVRVLDVMREVLIRRVLR